MHEKEKVSNYLPHAWTTHRSTRRSPEDYEDYLRNLSSSVGRACDKWLAARGIETIKFIQFGAGSRMKFADREESDSEEKSS